jgi:NADPH-dependent 2,4-dienoyl-CoA reductase/sulfur reductase-like enzyme
MAAAAQARRRDPSLHIVALEKGRHTSYSACGIPYLVGGEVDDVDRLVARTPQQFRDTLNIDVRLRHEVTALDLQAGTVEVRNHERERTLKLGFDLLHLGTGARPTRPDLPGIDLPFVRGVQTLEDGSALLALLATPPRWAQEGIRRVTVVGAGYIGLEMAEAFLHRGCEVTVVTDTPEVMPTLDADIGARVTRAMRAHGVTVRCGEAVVGFETGVVHTAAGPIPTDLAVLGLGVTPNSGLAADAGLSLGHRRSIVVDRRQRTSHPAVWAAGDCCESHHLVSEQGVHIALGTVANKQGRVAGINLGGGYATFPGVVGTAATKLCSLEVARTGLSEREAHDAGFAFVSTTVDSTTRAGYLPGAAPMTVKIVVERNTGRLLGAQIVGAEGAAKRIDVLATCVTVHMRVEDMTNLDLSYAPPFAPVWDPVLAAARKAAGQVDRSP